MLRTRLIAGAVSGFVLSAVFATTLTLTGALETFFEPLRVEPSEPAPVSLRLPRVVRGADGAGAAHKDRPGAYGVTVHRGDIVTDPDQASAIRVFEQGRRPPRPLHLAAAFLVHFIVGIMMTTYLRRGSARQGALLRTQVGLTAIALLFLIANKLILLLTALPPVVIPIGLVPLWSALYLDRRTALLMSIVMTVLSTSLVAYDPIVCAVYFSHCAAGSLYLLERKHSTRLWTAGALSGLAGAVAFVATKELFDGFDLREGLFPWWRAPIPAALGGGLLAGALGFVLQPLVSRILGVLTRSQLLNLTDLEQPLLRKMASEAPGSWEHSRAMANLAEAAAASIHADALLTRTGAYYHDLGKTCQPKYYVENLLPGEESPHEGLDPDISADAIMAHVIEGVRILREGRIPEPVIEFVYTHHGTSVIEYFWHKCLQQGNPKQRSEAAFRYHGMPPRTKETAILMLIDSIEAGARTVDPPTREGFDQLVRRVVFTKLAQGQLDDCGLTLEDLRTLANQIAETLVSVRHQRIRYPWQDDPGELGSDPPISSDRPGRAGDGLQAERDPSGSTS